CTSRNMMNSTALSSIMFVAILRVILEVTSRLSGCTAFMFPGLIQVLETLFNGIIHGQITIAIMQSLGRLLIGFSIAASLGLVFGYLIWRYKFVEDTLGFLVTALQSIPSIVWFRSAII